MRIINDPSIIDCTPITIRDGEHPNRLVLRDLGDNHFVIHRESMKINGDTIEHMSFYHGEYFGDLDRATDMFNIRAGLKIAEHDSVNYSI